MPVRSLKKKPAILTPESIAGTGLEFLKEDSLVRIEILGEETPNGSLIILEGDSQDIACTAAKWVASTVLGGDFQADFYSADPAAGSSFTVEDMDRLLTRTLHHPVNRHVILLPIYTDVRPGVMDRLLLLLEDTKVPLLVILCTGNFSALPGTIVGRSVETVTLDVLPADLRQEYLMRQGASSLAAREAVEIAGNQPHLASIFVKSAHLRAFAKSTMASSDPLNISVTSLLKTYTNICALAVVVANPAAARDVDPKSFVKELRYDALSPAEQDCAKKLLHLWCHRQRSHIAGYVQQGAKEPTSAECILMLERLDDFERTLRVPTNPTLALGAYGSHTNKKTTKPRPRAPVQRAGIV